MKIGFLITARLKSSRLPLKLLLDLNGRTVFERVVERCKAVSNIDEIILCTSTNPQDKPLVDVALKNSIYYYLGSEADVLQRLSDAATFFNLDYIINITGENPLFSIYHANLVVNLAKQNKYDFINIKGLPIGCAVYGIRPEALKTVCEVKEEIDTEIWGPLINRPDVFNVKEIDVEEYYTLPKIRITTDYPEDYRFISAIYKHFSSSAIPNLSDVIELFNNHPSLLEINKSKEQAALPKGTMETIDIFYKQNLENILKIKDKNYKNDKR